MALLIQSYLFCGPTVMAFRGIRNVLNTKGRVMRGLLIIYCPLKKSLQSLEKISGCCGSLPPFFKKYFDMPRLHP
jgi:hypothetical protein